MGRGIILVSLLSVNVKHEALEDELTKRQIYLGKGAFFIMMGIIQALIVTIGDLVILKRRLNHRHCLS